MKLFRTKILFHAVALTAGVCSLWAMTDDPPNVKDLTENKDKVLLAARKETQKRSSAPARSSRPSGGSRRTSAPSRRTSAPSRRTSQTRSVSRGKTKARTVQRTSSRSATHATAARTKKSSIRKAKATKTAKASTRKAKATKARTAKTRAGKAKTKKVKAQKASKKTKKSSTRKTTKKPARSKAKAKKRVTTKSRRTAAARARRAATRTSAVKTSLRRTTAARSLAAAKPVSLAQRPSLNRSVMALEGYHATSGYATTHLAPAVGVSYGLAVGTGGAVVGVSLGYTQSYFYTPFAASWGPYSWYGGIGCWYYPHFGFWYHPLWYSWYWPWTHSWYWPNYYFWWYPSYGYVVYTHALWEPRPYILIENDASDGMWAAVYEQRKNDDGTINYFQVEAPRMIESKKQMRLYTKDRNKTDVIIMSRDERALVTELTQEEAQKLSTVELARPKGKRPETDISDEDASTIFHEEAAGKEGDLSDMEKRISKEDLKNLPEDEEGAPGLEEAKEAKE